MRLQSGKMRWWLFDQREIWVDEAGYVQVEEMEHDHACALICFLLRQEVRINTHLCLNGELRLRQTPLFRAVLKRTGG